MRILGIIPGRTVLAGSVVALFGTMGSVMAGGLGTPPAAQPAVFAPAPMMQSYDWSGPYAGAQLGWGWADASPDVDGGDNGVGGFHGGYRWDFGTLVAGAELEYNWTDIKLSGPTDDTTVSGMFNVKGSAGVEAGPALIYATVGWGQAQADGNFDALIGGLGVAYPINDRWVASGEWLYYNFDDVNFDNASVAWGSTVTVRVSYRF